MLITAAAIFFYLKKKNPAAAQSIVNDAAKDALNNVPVVADTTFDTKPIREALQAAVTPQRGNIVPIVKTGSVPITSIQLAQKSAIKTEERVNANPTVSVIPKTSSTPKSVLNERGTVGSSLNAPRYL